MGDELQRDAGRGDKPVLPFVLALSAGWTTKPGKPTGETCRLASHELVDASPARDEQYLDQIIKPETTQVTDDCEVFR